MFFVIKETKETILNFPEGTVKVLSIYFVLIWMTLHFKRKID